MGISKTDNFQAFENYLVEQVHLKEKYVPFYKKWIKTAYRMVRIPLNQALTPNQREFVLKKFSQSYSDWQVQQADDALRHYTYFLDQQNKIEKSDTKDTTVEWLRAKQKMQQALLLKHRSYQTEKSYLSWVDSFCSFLQEKSPSILSEADIQQFLSYLSVEKQVAPSTQNQALNALVFFFRNALNKELTESISAVRSYRQRKLPVVLSKKEIQEIFKDL